jgi:hypothetical protein
MDESTRSVVLSGANNILSHLRAVDASITATLAIVQKLDRQEPKLAETLRRHGLIQEMSGVAHAIANLEIATGEFFKSLDRLT